MPALVPDRGGVHGYLPDLDFSQGQLEVSKAIENTGPSGPVAQAGSAGARDCNFPLLMPKVKQNMH